MSDERVPEDREPAVADDMAGEYVAGPGTVVGFFYDLYDGSGEKIESRREGAPVLILFGEPSILAALQDALRGKQVGEDVSGTPIALNAFPESSLRTVRPEGSVWVRWSIFASKIDANPQPSPR